MTATLDEAPVNDPNQRMSIGSQGRVTTPLGEADQLRRAQFRLLGTRVHALDVGQVVAWVDAWVQAGRGAHVATVNPEFVMRARHDASFRAVLETTRLNVPDGIGVVLAGRLQLIGVPARVTGIDLIWETARLARYRGWRLMLVGGAPGIGQAAAERLSRQLPGLAAPAVFVGEPGAAGDSEARAALREARPHLVFVAYGAPAQEHWIARNVAGRVTAVAIGVGGALDVVSGRMPRAPGIVRAIGMEWAFRLWREPRRWRRMRVLPSFAWLAAREARELRARRAPR